jgi:hypothetical protein
MTDENSILVENGLQLEPPGSPLPNLPLTLGLFGYFGKFSVGLPYTSNGLQRSISRLPR